jgi:hypothetical protein
MGDVRRCKMSERVKVVEMEQLGSVQASNMHPHPGPGAVDDASGLSRWR